MAIFGTAKTEIITENEVFTDYFNLMKTNEGWFIVDKVAVRIPKRSGDISQIKSELNVKPEKEVVLENLKRPWSRCSNKVQTLGIAQNIPAEKLAVQITLEQAKYYGLKK